MCLQLLRELSAQDQTRTALRYLSQIHTVRMSVSHRHSSADLLRRLCHFLVHTTNGRTGEKGVDCHRKLRGKDDITLDLTGKVLQRRAAITDFYT